MPVYDGEELTQESLFDVAKLCVLAAMKAPRITGLKVFKTEIITGDDVLPIIEAQETLADIERDDIRRGLNFSESTCLRVAYEAGMPVVLLVIGGMVTRSELNWNCGACGFKTCADFNTHSKRIAAKGGIQLGPQCHWKLLDYCIACAWAGAAAWQYNVDNRALVSVSRATRVMGYLEDYQPCLVLPIGPAEDVWWYNRSALRKKYTADEFREMVFRCIPQFYVTFPGTYDPPFRYDTETFLKKPMKLRRVPVSEIQPHLSERQQEAIKKITEMRVRVETKRGELVGKVPPTEEIEAKAARALAAIGLVPAPRKS